MSYAVLLWLFAQFSFDARATAFLYSTRRLPSFRTGSMLSVQGPFCVEAFINATNVTETSDPAVAVSTRPIPNVSAREWMENIEQREGSLHGVGAYTVLRCDVTYPASIAMDGGAYANKRSYDIQWNIWGFDFHMERLCSSYTLLLERKSSYCTLYEESKRETEELMHTLLDHACKALYEEEATSTLSLGTTSTSNKSPNIFRTLMLTVLWTPPKQQQRTPVNQSLLRPTVRCHASFAGPSRASIDDDNMPPSISACIALPDELTSTALAALPCRYCGSATVGATAKISSWCRVRRPLEDAKRYKVPEMNVGEVLLVNQPENATSHFMESLEILEGLTSNLLVIYKDGTVRTAPALKVLAGYSRHLVLKALLEMTNLVLDERAPTVQDANAGLWSEVFVTSAIRLLIPVDRVLSPMNVSDSTTHQMTMIWTGDGFVQTDCVRNTVFQIGLDESTIYLK
jgi:hypothetical protein